MSWKWNTKTKTNMLPVDFCRDKQMFDVSELNQKREGLNPDSGVTQWKWCCSDGRVFVLPVEIYQHIPKNGNLVRDVIAFLSQKYIDTGDQHIEVSLRQITEGIGMSWNSKKSQNILDALMYAKMLTIRNQAIYQNKNGKFEKTITLFNFLDWVQRTEEIDGVKIPANRIKTQIKVSDLYAGTLDNIKGPKAPVPVTALEIVNKSAPEHINPAKNLVYRLSARVPSAEVEYRTESMIEILGLKPARKSRLQKSISSVIEILCPTMILDYQYCPSDDKYKIRLNGIQKFSSKK